MFFKIKQIITQKINIHSTLITRELWLLRRVQRRHASFTELDVAELVTHHFGVIFLSLWRVREPNRPRLHTRSKSDHLAFIRGPSCVVRRPEWMAWRRVRVPVRRRPGNAVQSRSTPPLTSHPALSLPDTDPYARFIRRANSVDPRSHYSYSWLVPACGHSMANSFAAIVNHETNIVVYFPMEALSPNQMSLSKHASRANQTA
jgi:hypothetical protein